jgi:hypothetical protein
LAPEKPTIGKALKSERYRGRPPGQRLIEILNIVIVDAAKNVGEPRLAPSRNRRLSWVCQAVKDVTTISMRNPLYRLG